MDTDPFPDLPPASDADRRALRNYVQARASGPSRHNAEWTLELLAKCLGCASRHDCPWLALEYEHAVYLREVLQPGRQPKSVNYYLSILKGLSRKARKARLRGPDPSDPWRYETL
jgi:hypothetical protein